MRRWHRSFSRPATDSRSTTARCQRSGVRARATVVRVRGGAAGAGSPCGPRRRGCRGVGCGGRLGSPTRAPPSPPCGALSSSGVCLTAHQTRYSSIPRGIFSAIIRNRKPVHSIRAMVPLPGYRCHALPPCVRRLPVGVWASETDAARSAAMQWPLQVGLTAPSPGGLPGEMIDHPRELLEIDRRPQPSVDAVLQHGDRPVAEAREVPKRLGGLAENGHDCADGYARSASGASANCVICASSPTRATISSRVRRRTRSVPNSSTL